MCNPVKSEGDIVVPLLTVQQLAKRFGDYPALGNVSFEVLEGEIVGLIGPNGAGKTTLMECVAGLMAADTGAVSWQGKPLPPAQRKQHLFYLPDNVLPYGERFVIEILGFFRKVFGATPEQQYALVRQLALESVLRKRIGALSKGYRRRFVLAIGLLSPQPLLLLDEPFDGLDLRQTREVIGLLQQVRGTGRTLFLSIHQLTDAEKICDRFLLLSNGHLLGSGTLDELRQSANLTSDGLEEVFLALT